MFSLFKTKNFRLPAVLVGGGEGEARWVVRDGKIKRALGKTFTATKPVVGVETGDVLFRAKALQQIPADKSLWQHIWVEVTFKAVRNLGEGKAWRAIRGPEVKKRTLLTSLPRQIQDAMASKGEAGHLCVDDPTRAILVFSRGEGA